MFGDSVRESANRIVKAGSKRLYRKPFKGADQCVHEATHAIAMSGDVLALNLVQHLPDIGGRELAVVEK